jgi:hypothetical protein
VQTEAYKEAVAGIKMAIIHRHHPYAKLDQTQIDIIQEKLLTAVDVNPSRETPTQFLYSKFAQGAFWIPCAYEKYCTLSVAARPCLVSAIISLGT